MQRSKVLVVEDERIVALNLKQRLVRLGYDVPELAVSAEQAMKAVRDHQPDVVLMDIHIEGDLDGIEAAQLIRKERPTPVIYLTAYSEESTLSRARDTGPYGYLLKPFSERELHATIQMALERHRMEAALQKSEARLRFALSAANMGAWELKRFGDDGETLYAGQADTMLGYREQVFCGSRSEFLDLVATEDQARVERHFEDAIADNIPCDIEFRSAVSADSERTLRLQGKMLEESRCLQLIGVIQDVTENKKAEEVLKNAATVFEATQDGILILDSERDVVNCNASFTKMTGYTLSEIKGNVQRFVDIDGMRAASQASLYKVLDEGGSWRGEAKVVCKDGQDLPALIAVNSVELEQRRGGYHFVVVITDLTAIRAMERQLEYLAHHDPLTNLPNRLLLKERLHQALVRGQRHQVKVAVLYVDVDHFKWVNDSLGHEVGDRYLQHFTRRMSEILRESDIIGRLGGDEFLVVLDPVDNESSVATVVQKLISELCRPVTISDRRLGVSCSIGVSIFPNDGQDVETLIRTADAAMFAAKESGRCRFEFYTPEMMVAANRFIELNLDLRRGFLAGELCLHYQPQVAVESGDVVGVEALVRWQHPEKGMIPPDDFISIAEESGQIVELGEWILKMACTTFCRWKTEGAGLETISVNVSPIQLKEAGFVDTVNMVVKAVGIAPQNLELEVTESALQLQANAIHTLEKLRAIGVKIAIDDFGTGYSSLSSLKLLPIDRIKIDRAFIRNLPNDENDKAIAELIIAIGHTLGLQVIAEGVESKAQLDYLSERGCAQVQGFYYYKPLTEEDMEALLLKPAVQ